MGRQQGGNSGRFLVVRDEIRRSSHGVTLGQGAIFCSGYSCSSGEQRDPKTWRAQQHRTCPQCPSSVPSLNILVTFFSSCLQAIPLKFPLKCSCVFKQVQAWVFLPCTHRVPRQAGLQGTDIQLRLWSGHISSYPRSCGGSLVPWHRLFVHCLSGAG